MAEIINSKVVGVNKFNKDGTSRQQIIRDLLYNGDPLILEREPQNEFDRNAIAVYFDSPNIDEYLQVGYLPFGQAIRLAPLMDGGRVITAEVASVTQSDPENLGVEVTLKILSQEEASAREKWIEVMSKGYLKQHPHTTISRFSKSKKNVWIVLLLWLFLGIFGAHRWYVGRGSWLYSLTLGYLLIGWLFDFFAILLGEFRDKNGRRVWVV